MADSGEVPRPMKFPYTHTAQIAQFPYKHYFSNQWLWKYWLGGIALTLPVMLYIHRLSNSPENVKRCEDIKKAEAAAHH